MTRILVILCLVVIWPLRAAAQQGDGPRAYQLLPVGTNVLTLQGIALRSNQAGEPGSIIRGTRFDLNLGVVQYTRTIDMFGNSTGLIAALPFGEVVGRASLPRRQLSGRSSGIADPIIGGVIGLIGSPALSVEEYVRYKPGFALGLLATASVPLGAYDMSRLVNLGGNRWSFRIGAPMGYAIGSSFLDAQLTTFEFLPSVTFFTANDRFFGGREKSQEPLFKLEGHITRNLTQAVWVSADALYTFGGETATDGVRDRNTQRSLSLGGTVGVNLSPTFNVKASYGQSVYNNKDGFRGGMFRLVATGLF